MVEWTTVQIPKKLLKDVQDLIATYPRWINEREFIRDAIREKLAQTEQQIISKVEAHQ